MKKGSQSIPIIKATVPISGEILTLAVGGDIHYGVKGVDKEQATVELMKANQEAKGDIFWLWVGDMMENSLKGSVGHGYDLAIPDPQEQKEDVIDILTCVMEDVYGKKKIEKIDTKSENIRGVGVYGNHEYRTRNTAGLYLDRDIYEQAKIRDAGDQALIELRVVHTKLRKLEKTFKIYLKHRPYQTTATSDEAIIRMMRKKKSDIPGCDVYAYGHFHRRLLYPDGHFDLNTGEFKKSLYVITPSPMHDTEYADVAGYSPLSTGYWAKVFLPLDSTDIYGTV